MPCGSLNDECMTNGDCCGGSCALGQCDCVLEGATCAADADCCQHLRCSGGVCACAKTNATCTVDDDCCSGLLCDAGFCHPIGCFPSGETCIPNYLNQCCGGNTCGSDGICCQDLGYSCGPNRACCAPATCVNDICN
jgi:hypothetical protein